MNERKNIDQLFQEKFKNHEVAPPENAWQNIELKLKEKEKKRRITPFWWKFSTVAATLALLVVLFQNYDIQITKKGENSITTLEKNQKNKNIEKRDLQLNTIEKQSKIVNNETVLKNKSQGKRQLVVEEIADRENALVENSSTKNKLNHNKLQKNGLITFKEKRLSENSAASSENKNSNKVYLKSKKQYYSTIINNTVFTDKKESAIKNKKIIASTSIISDNSESQKTKNGNGLKNNIRITRDDFENNEDKIVENVKSNLKIENAFDSKTYPNNTKLDLESTKIKKNDSTKIAKVELNTLEKLLTEKEVKELKKKEPKLNRWQITSNVAPIYFSSSSNDSPLDSKFNNNQKEFLSNKGAGLGINYALSKKIKIRTGINVLSMSYSTKDVVFYETPINDKLNNLNPNAIGSKIQVENLNVLSPSKVNGKTSDFEIPNQKNINGASLNQKIGYVEVPIEMAYKVVDKKFSVDLIGGISTFYLRENTVSLKSNTVEMEIGEAKNLNKFHYSGNLGIGFKYAFLKHFEASVEPIYKYQINTFTNSDLNFRPNSFGIYSGINYNF